VCGKQRRIVGNAKIAKESKLKSQTELQFGFFGNSGDLGNLLLLVHHNIVLGLALGGGIHGGHANQIILFGVEFDRRLFYLGGDASKSRLALRVGINAHIEFVRAKRSIC
jgi:hypothetical protein